MPTFAWGCDLAGALGNNATTASQDGKSSPNLVVGLHTFVAVGAGIDGGLGLKSDGTAWSWGDNQLGGLGDNTGTNKSSPIAVVGAHSFTKIAAGGGAAGANTVTGNTMFGLKADGSAWGWGYNSLGAIGDNTTVAKSSPVAVVGAHSFVDIFTSCAQNGNLQFSAARKSSGAVWAWGYNGDGELGDGTLTGRNSPVAVIGAHSFVSISVGGAHTLALKSDGTAWAWGFNSSGQLGDQTITNKTSPIQVVGAHSFTQIAAGDFHSLGLKSDGSVWSWGKNIDAQSNPAGQLGDQTGTSKSSPVAVVGAHSFVRIFGGKAFYSAAMKSNGALWTWGKNATAGVLGDQTTTNKSSPVLVVGSISFSSISAGGSGSIGGIIVGTTDQVASGWGSLLAMSRNRLVRS